MLVAPGEVLAFSAYRAQTSRPPHHVTTMHSPSSFSAHGIFLVRFARGFPPPEGSVAVGRGQTTAFSVVGGRSSAIRVKP